MASSKSDSLEAWIEVQKWRFEHFWETTLSTSFPVMMYFCNGWMMAQSLTQLKSPLSRVLMAGLPLPLGSQTGWPGAAEQFQTSPSERQGLHRVSQPCCAVPGGCGETEMLWSQENSRSRRALCRNHPWALPLWLYMYMENLWFHRRGWCPNPTIKRTSDRCQIFRVLQLPQPRSALCTEQGRCFIPRGAWFPPQPRAFWLRMDWVLEKHQN